MKYFVNAEERTASVHENYVEFQLPSAAEEFWDRTSLYLPETAMVETGFGDFWCDCIHEGLVFDMDSFSKDELAQMADKAADRGGAVLEVISELKDWADAQPAEVIVVNCASDCALARRREKREAYPVDSEFYEEVREMQKRYEDVPLFERAALEQAAYEELLRKYNMPNCFFPFPLYEPEKCD